MLRIACPSLIHRLWFGPTGLPPRRARDPGTCTCPVSSTPSRARACPHRSGQTDSLVAHQPSALNVATWPVQATHPLAHDRGVLVVGVIACGRVSIQRGVLPVRVTASDSSLIVPLSR